MSDTRNPFTSDAIDDAIRRVSRNPCLLCGGRPHEAVLWHPSAEYWHLVQAPAGKVRIIAYTLCKACCNRRGVEQEAERVVIAQMRDDTMRMDQAAQLELAPAAAPGRN